MKNCPDTAREEGDNYFANITCLSVIEHEVDFNKFAAEISRLLTIRS
jgi:hypothetical protein